VIGRVLLGAVLVTLGGTGWVASAAPPSTAAPADVADPAPEAAADSAADSAAPESPAADDASTVTAPPPDAPIEGAAAIDAVLPCGVRVIVAEDDTLPVAAVVLAVETGPEDDPSDRPGLVHALAFHLLQGNRELTPGGAASIVHDAGGITELAIGPAQVRYESLVPVSRLDRAIWIEAQRLRAPTVSDELWAETLRWARRDEPRARAAPREIIAAAHRTPGLSHDGRATGSELEALSEKAIALALADRFDYTRATVTVVAPGEPADTLGEVMNAFADLPPATRRVAPRKAASTLGSAPRSIEHPDGDGAAFVWGIGPSPADQLRATVWCKAINRQARTDPEPNRARLRCHLDEDPRRGALVLRASGVDDPLAFVTARLARIEDGTDAPLVDRERAVVLDRERFDLRTPLPLARRLAQSAAESPRGVTQRAVDDLTGVAALDSVSTVTSSGVLAIAAAVRVVAPKAEGP
jgi:hypothetical protein